MNRKLMYGLVMFVFWFAVLKGVDIDASYDRFKVVGIDKLKDENSITVIEDTVTGCLYMRSTKGAYGIDTDPTLNKDGLPFCE